MTFPVVTACSRYKDLLTVQGSAHVTRDLLTLPGICLLRSNRLTSAKLFYNMEMLVLERVHPYYISHLWPNLASSFNMSRLQPPYTKAVLFHLNIEGIEGILRVIPGLLVGNLFWATPCIYCFTAERIFSWRVIISACYESDAVLQQLRLPAQHSGC